MSNDPKQTQTTETRHILTPIPGPNGRGHLCGSTDDASVYDGLDEAYRAHVEGWTAGTITCPACIRVALVAMEQPL